ncbi:MAG: hypothetical protein LBH04_03220 [Tannerellaceae bacterium]|jgi:hypothetical protein|nr:hypothetical protein [Tannerellaceae bacterium]
MNPKQTPNTCFPINIAILAIAITIAACQPETIAPPLPDKTLLIYFGGDNNLSDETYQKIKAIKEGLPPSSPQHNILLYHDPANATPTLTELKKINNQTTIDTIATYDETNSASPTTLAQVITQIQTTHPAKNYTLLIFSHGSGWLPQGALINPTLRSITLDGSTEMELAAFARAIPDHTFDHIVFEACFMAGIEVAYELRNKTNYILASSAEIVSPGFTAIYPDAFAYILDPTPANFANYAFNHFDQLEGEYRSATLSLVRTARLPQLASFISDHCRHDTIINVNTIQHFDRNRTYRLFFDFEDYYFRLLDNDAKRIELQRLIDDCVIWKASTPTFLPSTNGFNITRHSGLTVYIPQDKFPVLNILYQSTQWKIATLPK